MKEFANLHCHTQLSDGSERPISFLKKAARYTRYCAITDHNRLISSDEMFLWSHAVPEVTLVPGAEMSALYRPDSWSEDIEVHILTLLYTPGKTPHLDSIAQENQNNNRREYVNSILNKLRTECGLAEVGSYDDLRAEFPNITHIGRTTIARHLVNKQYVRNVEEAFYLYFGDRGLQRAFVKNPTNFAPMDRVVQAALADGAVPVLAHLFTYTKLTEQEQEVLVRRFREMAGDHPAGLEVFYYRYYHDPALIKKLQNLADRYNLLPSCGSDFHDLQNDTLNPGFPAEIYLNLFSAHQNYYRTQR